MAVFRRAGLGVGNEAPEQREPARRLAHVGGRKPVAIVLAAAGVAVPVLIAAAPDPIGVAMHGHDGRARVGGGAEGQKPGRER